MATRTAETMSRSPEFTRSQAHTAPSDVLSEEAFRRMIALERKRSERSQRPFVLLLIDTGQPEAGRSRDASCWKCSPPCKGRRGRPT